MADVGSAFITLMPSMRGFAGQIDGELGSAGKSAGKQFAGGLSSGMNAAGASTDGLRGKMSALSGVVMGAASSITSSLISSVGGLVGEMVSASDSAQKFASTLSFAKIDDSTIKQLTASTQEYADKTVYDLTDIRNVTAQLASNGVSDYARLAEAAGNLNAVAGGNASTFQSVGQVMTQTAGSGKLLTENWNQLTDAIPGASGALQDAMRNAGAFEGNFREAMENGEISADEFFAAVQQLGMQDVAVEAATSTSTIEGAVGNLQASVVGVGSQLVQAFTPFITGTMGQVSGVITGIGTAISTAGGYLGDWNGKLAEMSREMGGTATNGDLVALMVQDIAGQFGIGVEQSAGFADAIAGIVDAFQPLMTAVQNMGATLGPLVAQLGGAFLGLLQSLSPVVQMVATYFGQWWSTIVNVATAIGATFLPILTQVIGFVTTNIVPTLIPALDVILTGVGQCMTGIQTFVTTCMTGVQQIWNAVWPAIQAVVSAVMAVISAVVTGDMSGIQSIIDSVLGAIQGAWNSAWSGVSSFFSGIFDGMWSAARSGVDRIYEAVTGIRDRVLGFFSGAGQWLVDSGKAILDGLGKGIKDGFNAVAGAVEDGLAFIRGLFPFSPAKRGPFSGHGYTTFSGKALMEDFAGSIRGQVGTVEAAASDALGAARLGLSGGVYASVGAPASGDDGLVDAVNRLHDDLSAIMKIIPRGMTKREFDRAVVSAYANA